MKAKLMIVLALSCIMMSGSLFAQVDPPSEPTIINGDTLMVFPTYNSEAFDALNKWINYGFSLTPEIKIFRLARNETYKVSHPISTSKPLHIVALKPDLHNAPPLVVAATDLNNEFPWVIIDNYESVIVKNIYFCGADIEAPVLGECAQSSWMINVRKDSSTNIVDGCYFEWMGGDGASFRSSYSMLNLTYTNNLTMNSTTGGAEWWGVWAGYTVNLDGNPQGKVVIRNNTSINCPGPFFINWHDLCDSLVIDHNTVINNAIMCLFNTTWTDATISNNIFFNVGCEGIERQRLQAVDTLCWGIVNVDTLSYYNLDSTYAAWEGIPLSEVESHRKISLVNNYYGWTSEIIDYWNANDTLFQTKWMNTRIQQMFADDVNYPHFTEVGTYSMDAHGDPIFFGDGYCGSQTMTDFVGWMTNVLWQGGTEPTRYYWCPGQPDPQPNPAMVWPLQYDLRIGNPALVGSDGKPLGDLNWYPQYAQRWNPNVLSVDETTSAMPVEFKLNQNYPNPFNPTTTISYFLPKKSEVKLIIYNVLGQKVKMMTNGNAVAGTHKITWNGLDYNGHKVASGVYYYRLEAEDFTSVKKMILLK